MHAQALDGSARDVLDVVRRTGFLQLDPTARVAPTQLLVLWSRLGHYDPAELDRLVWNERKLFEWSAFVYPVEDLPALKARMRNWPRGDGAWSERVRAWLRANQKFRRHVLRELGHSGPLPSRAIEDRVDVPWPSSGWTNDRNVTQMLEFLNARGEVAIAGRGGSSGCGTSRNASTTKWRRCRRMRRTRTSRSAGCARLALRGKARGGASRLGPRAPGSSILRRTTRRCRGGRHSCRRSTA